MSALLDVLNVLHEPTAVFTRVKEKPRVLIPWLAVCVLVVVVGVVMRPYQAAAMDALRASLPPETAARMGAGGQSIIRVVIGAPIVVLLGLAIGAGLLWIGTSITGAAGQYKTLFSVLTYSYITYVICSALTAVDAVGDVGVRRDAEERLVLPGGAGDRRADHRRRRAVQDALQRPDVLLHHLRHLQRPHRGGAL